MGCISGCDWINAPPPCIKTSITVTKGMYNNMYEEDIVKYICKNDIYNSPGVVCPQWPQWDSKGIEVDINCCPEGPCSSN